MIKERVFWQFWKNEPKGKRNENANMVLLLLLLLLLLLSDNLNVLWNLCSWKAHRLFGRRWGEETKLLWRVSMMKKVVLFQQLTSSLYNLSWRHRSGVRYTSTLSLTSALAGGRWLSRRGRFTPGRDPAPIVQDSQWAPGPVWIGAENLTAAAIR